MTGVEREVIDKDSETFLEYQMELRQCISDKMKYKEDIQKCSDIIIGQCSSSVEQNLELDDKYIKIKERSDSITVIKLLKTLCYNYKAYEYTLLVTWDVMNKLGAIRQPEDLHEAKHYESFWSVDHIVYRRSKAD